MKPVYRCDFCGKMGTAEEIEDHEKVCKYNPAVKHCYTCMYCTIRPGCFGDVSECALDDATIDGHECTGYKQGHPRKIIAV